MVLSYLVSVVRPDLLLVRPGLQMRMRMIVPHQRMEQEEVILSLAVFRRLLQDQYRPVAVLDYRMTAQMMGQRLVPLNVHPSS